MRTSAQGQPAVRARIKKLRQDGYYVATTKRECPTCGKRTFFDLLIRLPRNAADNEKRFTISVSEIKKKFQLLTNQTNLQKERYCKNCVSTGIRGDFFGIEWFYEGNKKWQGTSKADENGCIGCCWYDLNEWKKRFNKYLQEESD